MPRNYTMVDFLEICVFAIYYNHIYIYVYCVVMNVMIEMHNWMVLYQPFFGKLGMVSYLQ